MEQTYELKVEIAKLQEQIANLCRSMDEMRDDMKHHIEADTKVTDWMQRVKGAGYIIGILQVVIFSCLSWALTQIMNNKDHLILVQYKLEQLEKR
jgi:hypothetical protein